MQRSFQNQEVWADWTHQSLPSPGGNWAQERFSKVIRLREGQDLNLVFQTLRPLCLTSQNRMTRFASKPTKRQQTQFCALTEADLRVDTRQWCTEVTKEAQWGQVGLLCFLTGVSKIVVEFSKGSSRVSKYLYLLQWEQTDPHSHISKGT